ncbi:MAG: hypothetical protein U0892_03205 [Pirellulales bacterium]
MNVVTRKLSTYLFASLLVSAAAAAPNVCSGQDIIGVLPEVQRPEIREKLKLTDEQKSKFDELIKKRSGEAIGLAQTLRETPPDQKEVVRNQFREESERLGFEILDVEQRAALEQIRVNRLGLLALGEPGISKSLNLADWQLEKIRPQIAKAIAARGADSDRVRAESEKAIRGEISDSQWAAWQFLAGQSTAANIGMPQPPEKKVDAPTVAASTGSPSDVVATASKADKIPVDQVRLQMNFQATPWDQVLKWICEQADLSLHADMIPPGSFTYRDNSKTYSVGEALDIMSASLLNRGYSLLRRDRWLMVVDLEAPLTQKIVKELAQYVDEEKLDTRGDFELVKCLFTLTRMSPDEAKKEIEPLLSLQGTVVSLPASGQIQVTDTAGIV